MLRAENRGCSKPNESTSDCFREQPSRGQARSSQNAALAPLGSRPVQYVADLKPETKLAPALGTASRRRLQEWLHFIATELHKAFGPINHPKTNPELKQALQERLASRFAFLASALQGKSYLVDDVFTVADGYAFYTLRNWQKLVGPELGDSQVLRAYFARIAARPAVQEALKAEGLS